MTNRIDTSEDLNVVMLEKKASRERYIFLVSDSPLHIGEALRTMGRFAANPELSFSWMDAAALSQKLRQLIS